MSRDQIFRDYKRDDLLTHTLYYKSENICARIRVCCCGNKSTRFGRSSSALVLIITVYSEIIYYYDESVLLTAGSSDILDSPVSYRGEYYSNIIIISRAHRNVCV